MPSLSSISSKDMIPLIQIKIFATLPSMVICGLCGPCVMNKIIANKFTEWNNQTCELRHSVHCSLLTYAPTGLILDEEQYRVIFKMPIQYLSRIKSPMLKISSSTLLLQPPSGGKSEHVTWSRSLNMFSFLRQIILSNRMWINHTKRWDGDFEFASINWSALKWKLFNFKQYIKELAQLSYRWNHFWIITSIYDVMCNPWSFFTLTNFRSSSYHWKFDSRAGLIYINMIDLIPLWSLYLPL